MRFAAFLITAACSAGVWLGQTPAYASVATLPPLDPHAVRAKIMADPEKARSDLTRYTAPGAAVRPEDQMNALHFITNSYEMQGKYSKAVDQAQQWFKLADQRHDVRNMAQASNELGASNSPLGNLDVAVKNLKYAADLAGRIKDVETWSEALFNLSVLMLNYGDYENALTYSLEAQKVMQEHGGMSFPPSGFGARANIYYRLGRFEDAQRALTEAEKGLPGTDNIGSMQISGMAARVEERLGRFAEAKKHATQCIDISQKIKAALSEKYTCELALATLAIESNSIAEARDHLGKVKEALNETPESAGTGKTVLERDYHQGLADLAKAEGRLGEVASERALISELDRKLWSARDTSRAAVAAAEIKTEGKDLSIALLEARNANLRLEARQRLVWIGSALLSGLAILTGLFLWYRGRQAQMRQEQRHIERTRIARELHDTLLQNMAGAQMQLQAVAMLAKNEDSTLAGRLGAMVEQLGETMASARDAVWQMRSAAIERGDLIEALEEWIAHTRTNTATTIGFDASAAKGLYSPSQAEDIFRVAQEAVGNALRHAAAGQIEVRLVRSSNTIELSVSDNGRGFNLQSGAAGFGGHWGLVGMRERAARLKGSLDVKSEPGAGTEIVLTLPA